MKSKRLGYIDIAKCIAIAFIILGHTGLSYKSQVIAGGMPNKLVMFAFTFHLPLFLVLSGYFFSPKVEVSLSLIRKDAKNLLLPYATTSCFIICGCTLLAHVHGLVRKEEFVRWFQAALWGAGDRINGALWNVERIGGIWFLLALFWAHLIIASTHKLPSWARLLTLAVCMCTAGISSRFVWLPWSFQCGLGCALYLYVGMLIREADGFSMHYSLPFVLVLALAWGYVVALQGGGSVAAQHYPLGAATVLGGISATLLVVKASQIIEAHATRLSQFMQWVGRNTLPIFCMHIFEDTIFWWWQIGGWFTNFTGGWKWTWVIVLLLRFALDAALVGAVYILPPTRYVFFPRSIKRSS